MWSTAQLCTFDASQTSEVRKGKNTYVLRHLEQNIIDVSAKAALHRPAPRTQAHVEPHALTEVWATSAHTSWSPSRKVILSQGGRDQVCLGRIRHAVDPPLTEKTPRASKNSQHHFRASTKASFKSCACGLKCTDNPPSLV